MVKKLNAFLSTPSDVITPSHMSDVKARAIMSAPIRRTSDFQTQLVTVTFPETTGFKEGGWWTYQTKYGQERTAGV